MPPAPKLSTRAGVVAILLVLTFGGGATAQSVWSGFDFSFTKPNDTDPTAPENQDRITANVWITRSVQSGIFNFASEESYTQGVSPAGTAWATDINNPGETIAATNWASLDFDPWIDAYGGAGSMALPAILISHNAVLHLIADDIYLDLQFTDWTAGGLGGGFSYDRAEAPPGPTTTGDYNQDDVVDAADYVLWRDTKGQPAVPAGSGADGNVNGTIDDPDYVFWAAHFGENVPGSASAEALNPVPEPAALALLLCGIGLSVSCSRFTLSGLRRMSVAWRFP